MRVDIWSDVVCPWCYVGKARFEKALAGFGHRDHVEVVYRSFELDPSRDGTRYETALDMLSKKYGMPLEQASEDCGGEVVGPRVAKRSPRSFPDGRAKALDDDCVRHLWTPDSMSHNRRFFSEIR